MGRAPRATSARTSSQFFDRFAGGSAEWTGRPWSFALAVLVLLVWAVTGPLFGFSDTWQLIINTGTTIVTFLMVFLIQHSENKNSRALQMKLDELIAATSTASNRRRTRQRRPQLTDASGALGSDGRQRRPARPLERAVHRGDAHPRGRGDLGRTPSERLAQYEDRSLAAREIQRDGQGPPDRLPPDDQLRGVCGQLVVVGSRDAVRREVHEVRAATPPLVLVNADVRGDAVQPRAHRRPALEAVKPLPRTNHRLLCCVIGVDHRTEHPLAVPRDLDAVKLEQRGVGGSRL